MTQSQRVALSGLSEKAESFDLFVSHCWASSGISKFFHLLLREGSGLSLLAWGLAAGMAMLLCSVKVLPMPADYVIKILHFSDPAPFGFWVFGFSLIAVIVGFALTPYLPGRTTTRCFIDVVSINQARHKGFASPVPFSIRPLVVV